MSPGPQGPVGATSDGAEWPLGPDLPVFVCARGGDHRLIANILGFGGAQYKSGAFFVRGDSPDRRWFQVDLMFNRADGKKETMEIENRRLSFSI